MCIRDRFDNFEPARVARYSEARIETLLGDAGIVRSRAKIEAAIGGARIYLAMEKSGENFADYVWSYVGGKPIVHRVAHYKDAPTQSPESAALAKDLKARGFKFCGPVIVYAFMQAVGMVNDHLVGCFRHDAVHRMSAPDGPA